MSAIGYPNPDDLPEPIKSRFDKLPNLFRLMLHSPKVFEGNMALAQGVMAGPLAPDIREYVILATFRLEGGNYGWVQHIPIAEKLGCPKEKVEAIAALNFEAPIFTDKERAALQLTREVVHQVRASDAALARAKQHFSAQEIFDIVAACSYYGMNIRLAETLRIEDEPAFRSAATSFKREVR